MRIVFDLYNVGLGNNGGTRTLIKCAEVLSECGIDVIMFSNVPSKYTWHKATIKHVQGHSAPPCDVLIATGYDSVKNALMSKAAKKYYYIRGFELWRAPASKLFQSFKSLKCIVNSQWLYNLLKSKKINSSIIYPGLDFKKFKNLNLPRNNSFGALYSQQHSTKRYADALQIKEMTGLKLQRLNKDIKDANDRQMNEWYNTSGVWFAPTELEGLHNPPMEVSLTGCPLVCTDHERSGMQDYAIHNQTALVYPAGNLKLAAKYISKLLNDKAESKRLNDNMIHLLKTKIGSRKSNMIKLLDYIRFDLDKH